MTSKNLIPATMDMLRRAGFHVGYAERPEHDRDYISWSAMTDYDREASEAYVDLSRVANGEDAYGQVTTVDRSNYRSLTRDYPDTFTSLSYSNCDALGAFISDLSDDLVTILVNLATDYPLYDESDLSELESEEVTESWEQYVQHDIRSELSDLADPPPPVMGDDAAFAALEAWDALDDENQAATFWQAVETADAYPEHDGHDVLWSYKTIVTAIVKALS